MPNLRGAFLCAFSAVILLSCKTHHNDPIAKSKPGEEPKIKTTIYDESADINPFQSKFMEAAMQHFTVPSKRVSLLTAKGGLKIKVDPGSLEREDGSMLNGIIEVSVIEHTNVNDLFKSNAATVSDGRLLVSGGSYFIGMESGGAKLRIKKGETLETEFPMLKKENMELFYGERDKDGNMNWLTTGNPLEQQYDTISMKATSNTFLELPDFSIKKGYHLYESADTKVLFWGNVIKLKDMISTLQRKGIDKVIDTVYYYRNYGRFNNKGIYSREDHIEEFYPIREQVRIISGKESRAEKDSLSELICEFRERRAKMQKEGEFNIQLRNSYSPTSINRLGWINCDRFYNSPQQTVPDIELPFAFNNSLVHYFVLFKSMNSLLSGQTVCNLNSKAGLQSLPLGEAITLIAFVKKDGIIYRAKQDLVTEKNKSIRLELKKISQAEITDLFSTDSKI